MYIYICVCVLPAPMGWALNWGICRLLHALKYNSSYKLSTSVADSVYVKKRLDAKISLTYADNDDGYGVRYPSDVKSAEFRSLLEASRGSSHTVELWYNETVYLWITIYIYIYIYICMYACMRACEMIAGLAVVSDKMVRNIPWKPEIAVKMLIPHSGFEGFSWYAYISFIIR